MTFDPFGDFATEGYLRNFEKEKDLAIIKRAETVHSVLAQRAGFSIDWSATKKDAYLDALTREIENPSKGHLDAYLKSLMRDPVTHEHLAAEIVQAPGLDGSVQDAELNEVLGNADEPAVKAQYEAMLTKRKPD